MTTTDCDRTRVAPVFNWLVTQDPSGRSWVRRLLTLPGQPSHPTRPVPAEPGRLREAVWWPRTPSLEEPPDLATHQIRTLEATMRDLERTENPDIRTLDWFTLGPVKPNALVVTTRVMAAIEARRDPPTSLPSPLDEAFRIVRHLDALFQQRRGRIVVAMLIVEEHEADPGWLVRFSSKVAEALANPEFLATWLPHRDPPERQAITQGFLGVTTWQHLCRELGIPWSALPDTVLDVPPHETLWHTSNRACTPEHEHAVVVGRDLDPSLEAHRRRLAKRAPSPFPPMTLTDAARHALRAFYRSPDWRHLRDRAASGTFPTTRTRPSSDTWHFVLPHDEKLLAAIDWHADLLDATWDDAVDDALYRYYNRPRGG